MDLQTHFQLVHPEGSGFAREYIDLRSKSQQSLVPRHSRRITFVADLEKQSRKTPGPGSYTVNPEDSRRARKVYRKLDFEALKKSPRKTCIDAAIASKQRVPGVGRYQLENDTTEKTRQKYKALGDQNRKEAPLFKPSVFDDYPLDCLKVDPGTYELDRPFGQKKSFRVEALVQPDESDGKQQETELKRKSLSMPKIPHAQSYRPIPAHYNTFERTGSLASQVSLSSFGKGKRFKRKKEEGPSPQQYGLIAEWSPRGRESAGGDTFKSVSRGRVAGVYH